MTTRHPAEYRTVQAQRRRRGRAIRKLKRQGATTRQARAVLDRTTRAWDALRAAFDATVRAVRAVWDRIRAAVDAVVRLAPAIAQQLLHNGRTPR